MRTKKVNRYYCDFCKKSGGSAGHIVKHEKACTNNPNRVCGICAIAGYPLDMVQQPLADLMALLPDQDSREVDSMGEYFEWLLQATNDALPKLREATSGCPACMLAALRQSGLLSSVSFDFKKEMESFMPKVYAAQREAGGYY